MKKNQITAKFKIHKGKVDEFKKVANAAIAGVNENEKGNGALQYDWFFSPEQSLCVVRETYADSNAVLAHMGNVAELLGQLLSMSDFDLEVHGDLSVELQQAAEGLNPKVFSYYDGM